jgi:hypothetical protein
MKRSKNFLTVRDERKIIMANPYEIGIKKLNGDATSGLLTGNTVKVLI